MVFNSYQFLIFFPLTTFIYFILPHRYQWILLLVASSFFYMVFIPQYILILFLLITIDYFAALYIERSKNNRKKILLILSILSTCLVLFFFKYFNFFNTNFLYIARFFHLEYPIPFLHFVLPIGLSFHTFQSLSYVIEVYKKKQKAERHFGIYALYVMFYPQLVAGPIERPQHMLHQFHNIHTFKYQRVIDGLKLMTWGMFKKIVIADRLAILVNTVYNNPTDYTGLPLIIATIFFSFQIYCDFSGYSDIAIGSAQILGFQLMKNFNRPYFSTSISEFWKRWHISLSSWFKDYIYIPLGGNRVSPRRWQWNIMITFLISGLWHGANWTYILWGGIHGIYLIITFLTKNLQNNILHFFHIKKSSFLHKILSTFITFILVCFSWIFFRAKNIQEAFYIVSHIYQNPIIFFDTTAIKNVTNNLGLTEWDFIIAILAILLLLFVECIQGRKNISHILQHKSIWIRWIVYYFLILMILLFGTFNKTQFIYFQF